MGRGLGIGRSAMSAAVLLSVACSSSGGGETLTSYPGCLPPCIGNVLVTCIGNANSCTDNGSVTCWDSGARRTTSTSPADGGGDVQDDVFYAPSGAVCLSVHEVITGPSYTPVGTYADANGSVVATAGYDQKYGFVYHCDGNTYLAQPVLLSTNCSDNANLLVGNSCTQSFSCQ